MNQSRYYDVIVVGAGHAGCEAALAAARMDASVLLCTINMDDIATMPCNPAIGGIGKGQLVREIDALGGEMGQNTDASAIQFRMLNKSKGPAVWSPRSQCDKLVYQKRMKHVVERTKNIFVHQAEVVALTREKNKITGVVTAFDETFNAGAVVICSGTYLQGILHYGLKQFPGGKAGSSASYSLSTYLSEELKIELTRLKTGTPPRIMANSIDFSQLKEQPSDPNGKFSYWEDLSKFKPCVAPDPMPQKSCYITETTEETKQVVLDNIKRAPMYNGTIKGVPTRYCPSFEDKIMRFQNAHKHHVYIEPEGSFTEEYYLNGISTSLPVDVQWKMIQSLPGFKNAELSRYAYAIEYDIVLPSQLHRMLSLQRYPNLFTAGQLNGTTGYEEAAAQGLVAGANAAIISGKMNKRPFIPLRNQSYCGVLIDDLVTKDIVEPYRLFTSRAEYRLSLRQDNATRRLSKMAYDYGLLPTEKYTRIKDDNKNILESINFLKSQRTSGVTLWDRLRKKQIELKEVEQLQEHSPFVKEQIEIEAYYEGYIKLENARAENLKKLDRWKIPTDFEYNTITGMRIEAQQKLTKLRPDTLAQAARLDGVTPAEIGLLQVYLKRRKK